MAKKETMYTGGTPNFDEKTGTRIPRVGPPLKEKLTRLSPGVYRDLSGGLVGSRGQKLPGQRRQGPSLLDMARRAQPLPPASGGMPGPVPPMSDELQRVLDTWAKNFGNPPRMPQAPGRSLEDVAQERANAIRNGGMVTMDINIPRDRRVNEILGRPQPDYLNPDMQASLDSLLRRYSK